MNSDSWDEFEREKHTTGVSDFKLRLQTLEELHLIRIALSDLVIVISASMGSRR